MPKVDLAAIPCDPKVGYPSKLAKPFAGRSYQRLTTAVGLTDFGVNIVTLEPGAWSSQRHWHAAADEFVIVLEGEAVLVEDAGRTPLKAGECACFPKNSGNGHHLVNESGAPMRFLVIGSAGDKGPCHYPDVDLYLDGAIDRYRHKDGSFWE